MNTRSWIVALFAFLVALSPLPASAKGRTLMVPDAFTPVLVEPLGGPTAAVKGTDGRFHVVYELWLSNARPVPASIERIEVLDYDHPERVLATLEGEKLQAALHELSARPASDASLAPNASKLVYVEVAFESESAVPDAIVHRFYGKGGINPVSQDPAPMSYLVAPWNLKERLVPSLGPPLVGKGYVDVNGCCSGRGAHRGAILPVSGRLYDAQRYAIDWMRIDEKGRLLSGDPSKVESYFVYDLPVLAVADATVVEVFDGLDDQVPGMLPDPATINVQNIDGNHVILDIGLGQYAFYAHLKKGTVRVKVGDKVKRGAELGRVGNTGNTSGPHLHLHIVTANSALAADGIPYVFDQFNLTGHLDAEQWYGPQGELDDTLKILPADGPGARKSELPLDLDILNFPEATKR